MGNMCEMQLASHCLTRMWCIWFYQPLHQIKSLLTGLICQFTLPPFQTKQRDSKLETFRNQMNPAAVQSQSVQPNRREEGHCQRRLQGFLSTASNVSENVSSSSDLKKQLDLSGISWKTTTATTSWYNILADTPRWHRSRRTRQRNLCPSRSDQGRRFCLQNLSQRTRLLCWNMLNYFMQNTWNTGQIWEVWVTSETLGIITSKVMQKDLQAMISL